MHLKVINSKYLCTKLHCIALDKLVDKYTLYQWFWLLKMVSNKPKMDPLFQFPTLSNMKKITEKQNCKNRYSHCSKNHGSVKSHFLLRDCLVASAKASGIFVRPIKKTFWDSLFVSQCRVQSWNVRAKPTFTIRGHPWMTSTMSVRKCKNCNVGWFSRHKWRERGSKH